MLHEDQCSAAVNTVVKTELNVEYLHQARLSPRSLVPVINMRLTVTDRSEPKSNRTSAPRLYIFHHPAMLINN